MIIRDDYTGMPRRLTPSKERDKKIQLDRAKEEIENKLIKLELYDINIVHYGVKCNGNYLIVLNKALETETIEKIQNDITSRGWRFGLPHGKKIEIVWW